MSITHVFTGRSLVGDIESEYDEFDLDADLEVAERRDGGSNPPGDTEPLRSSGYGSRITMIRNAVPLFRVRSAQRSRGTRLRSSMKHPATPKHGGIPLCTGIRGAC